MSNVAVSVGNPLLLVLVLLMIAERMKDGLIHSKDKEMIERIARELTDVIEAFMCAVDGKVVSARCLNMTVVLSQGFCVEQELLLGRLKSVETGYHQDLRCMEGTRKSISPEGNHRLGHQ